MAAAWDNWEFLLNPRPVPQEGTKMALEMQWRPIDTCPREEGGAVILSDGAQVGVAEGVWWAGRFSSWDFFDPDMHFEPTYWMPLPGPPTSQARPAEE